MIFIRQHRLVKTRIGMGEDSEVGGLNWLGPAVRPVLGPATRVYGSGATGKVDAGRVVVEAPDKVPLVGC